MSPQELAELGDLAVLSYISPEGASQSAVVAVAVTTGLEIVFDTVTTSRKYRSLKSNPRCSICLWKGEVTVQYEGDAEETALDLHKEAYFQKFPDGRARLTWPGITHFVIHPKWIRHTDYQQRPPKIEELSL